jgi:hypothetical protein
LASFQRLLLALSARANRADLGWAASPALEVVKKYNEILKEYPNPPAGNLTRF